MQAWRVHEFGEPDEVIRLDEIPRPTAADLAGLRMSMGGWVPEGTPGSAPEPHEDWVIVEMSMAALALPDVTMAQGRYPVPVPRPYLLCEDDAVIGTMFYVMDCVHGRIFRDANLPGASPAERGAIYDSMNDVLARLHTVDWQKVGLADFGRPGNYYARQIHRWSQQYRASETEKIEAMERLMEWLPKHIPASDDTTLVHGDYRPGNMIVHPTEPRIVAVLDWELSTLGHPMADLAYNCMPYHLGNEWEGLRDAPLADLGIPTEQAYLDAYCRRTGRARIDDWEFYIAFAEFRLAAIAQGIMGRVIAGTANDPNARERGERARPLAEAAWRLVESRTH